MSTQTIVKQYRGMPGVEIRSVDEGKRQFVARVCNYNVVDSYGSVWAPGCFAESLKRKMPKVVWAHDWSDPIGIVIAYKDSADGLDVTVQLDDFADVPRARQCFSQLKSGSMDEFSFGFAREEWSFVDGYAEDAEFPGATEILTRARLDEVSPVLVGAVPNTALLSTRSAERMQRSDAAMLLTRVAAGAMPLSDALRALEAAPMTDPITPTTDAATPADAPAGDDEATEPTVSSVASGIDAAVDQMLTLLDGVDTTALPQEVQDALALVESLDTLADDLLDILGVEDPDEDSEPAGETDPTDADIQAALDLINNL